MNVNSKQTTATQTVNLWLFAATDALKAVKIPTPRLDAELLLAHVLKVNRTWLITHQNDNISDAKVLENASKLLAKRVNRVPIAYLTNHKEFYNRSFFVNESVLIPRPESEMIIELLKELVNGTNLRLLDVGTGSGALGITAKLEIPSLAVTVSDISPEALTVARKNAHTLNADIRFIQSDLLSAFSNIKHRTSNINFDIIIANLPYVDRSWERSPETNHEPALALFADDHGLALIKKCIQQASDMTPVDGYLLLESDPEQHEEIITYAHDFGFNHIRTSEYIVALTKRK